MFFKKSKRLQFRRKSLTSTRYPHVSRLENSKKSEKFQEPMANPANFATGREKGVAAYANRVEALRATGTCRTLLILNTCFLVLAGSTPTRGEWSLYTAIPPIFLFAAISLPRSAEPCFVSNGLSGSKSPPFDLFIASYYYLIFNYTIFRFRVS